MMISTMTDAGAAIGTFMGHEHEELLVGIDHIHSVADGLAALPTERKATALAGVLRWIDGTLKPHMAWEESWLCPQIDDRAPTVVRLIRFDHRQIVQMADRLRTDQSMLEHGPSRVTTAQVLSDLFGFEMLLRAAVEREAHFLMPLFDPEDDLWTSEWRD